MPRWTAIVILLAALGILVSAWLGVGPSGDCPAIGDVIQIGCKPAD